MRFDGLIVAVASPVGDEVVPARAQMAATLGFHIILACLGIALPAIVLLAEFIGLRRPDEVALVLARRWSQAMGVLVAVGAVTGTVLSFEMGLLWPGLMRAYGAVLGLPVVWLVHLCFDVMVGLGFLLLLAGLWALYAWWRHRRLPSQRLFWLLGTVSGLAAIVAMECGWVVTEVGRQPWVVYQLQTTTAAATTNGGVIASLSIIIVLYAVLGAATILIVHMLARRWRRTGDQKAAVPYGPPPGPPDRALGGAGL